MKIPAILPLVSTAMALLLLAGCRTPQPNPVALKPRNPSAVKVKVSLSTKQVYVMEGNQPLLVAATSIGLPGSHRTPTGDFRAFNKIAKKRSGSYGFGVTKSAIIPAESSKARGRYVGYPMPWWVEFTPAYGFHQGAVWPTPRTHGCLRLHKNVAAKFYALVKEGTPISIREHQPEDKTIGRHVPRPTDYNDPDLPSDVLISDAAFEAPAGPLLQPY